MGTHIKGISLAELLIVVILISAIATVYMNFSDGSGIYSYKDRGFSVVDSILYATLDKIALDLQMAHCNPDDKEIPLKIDHYKGTDKIRIMHNGVQTEYMIDGKSRLICCSNNGSLTLAENVISFKTREMGKETIVLTIIRRLSEEEAGDTGNRICSYSRVVTVNYPME